MVNLASTSIIIKARRKPKIETVLIAIIIVLLSVFIVFSDNLYALSDESFANGWYWGKDEKAHDNPIKKLSRNKSTKTIIKPNYTNLEVLNEIKLKIEEAKAAAILQPTIENVASYLKLQNRAVNLAANFSAFWQKAQLIYPELDYSAIMPTNNYARRLINANEREGIEQNVSKFAQSNGILFFFNGKDKVATYQSQIIKEFCAHYNIALLPVTLDGSANQYFPNATFDVGQAKKLNISITPAIIALNLKTKVTSPIAFGVLTETELKGRINNYILGDNNE